MTSGNRSARVNAGSGILCWAIPLASLVAFCGILALPAATAPVQPKVQFSKQILPLFNRECVSCHKGSAAPGGYAMDSAERLLAGGRHGKAVMPGKGAESLLVKYLTGELKPQMPPGRPIDLDSIALVKQWINEGAKIDSMTAPAGREKFGIMRDAMPMKGGVPRNVHGSGSALLPLTVTQSAPVTALAYSPDGKLLAAGGYRAVRLLDPATGSVLHTLSGPSDQVLSVAWSADGKRLAGAGGVSGAHGEVCVWEVPSGAAWGKPRVLKDHSDAIYSVAWRPGAQEFATGSLDKTVKLWDAASGSVIRTLKDHVDAVFGVAYSADGKWLATGSMDRSLKLYDAASRNRVGSFINPEGITAVAFSPKNDLMVCASDKQLRVWPVKAGAGENPLRAQHEGETISSVAFSADGSRFAWGAVNRRVRLFNTEVTQHLRELRDPITDWVYSVSLSPDGRTVAAGTGEGKVYFWSVLDGKLERSVSLGAAASVTAAAEGKK